VNGTTPPSFSLAHTAGLAVLAVARVEVGVDIERIAGPDVLEAARLALSDDERARMADWAPGDAPAAFLDLWTRKEAYLKGIGLGIVRDPRLVTFQAPADGWSTVIDDDAATSWRVRSLALCGEWIGAIAIDAPGASVRLAAWS
jgi:4'-phosphopantetheinyl transferase